MLETSEPNETHATCVMFGAHATYMTHVMLETCVLLGTHATYGTRAATHAATHAIETCTIETCTIPRVNAARSKPRSKRCSQTPGRATRIWIRERVAVT